jgi:hypothetical protein
VKRQRAFSDFNLGNAGIVSARGQKMKLEEEVVANRITAPGASRCLTGFEANGNMKAVVNAGVASTGGRWRVAAPSIVCAEVAELADALHSGCSARQGVEVRVLSSAPGFRPFKSLIQFRRTAIEKCAAL